MNTNLEKIFICFLGVAVGLSSVLTAQEKSASASIPLSSEYAPSPAFPYGRLNPQAPPETAVLGQLAGIWDAFQVKRNRDGAWSSDTTHAEWRWYYILEGHAIQDDWISLEAGSSSMPMPQAVGTNIRIYNPEEKQWHMAWIDKTNRRLATFTAIHEDGKVIMTGHNAQGRLIRNTFSNMTAQAFDWMQEWTADEGKTWFAVAKIWCKRRE